MNIDFNFLGSLEGAGIKDAYVPTARNGFVLGQSGVTIGTGVDLGQMGPTDLDALGISSTLKKKLTPYLGIKKAEALEFLAGHPLSLSEHEVLELDARVKQKAYQRLSKTYSRATGRSFEIENRAFQTVVFSVAYQYGDLPSRTPNFWKAVVEGDVAHMVHHLRNFGDKYDKRRNKEADYLEGK